MTGHATCQHRVYRMTCEQFEDLRERAAGRCEVCRIPAEETPQGKLQIDHDGRLGQSAVRGLLCPGCNTLVKFVEAGRAVDPRVTVYLAAAWHLTAGPVRAGRSTGRMAMRQVRIPPPLWREFGQAVGDDNRSAVLRDFMRWFVGEPGARKPRRPGLGRPMP